MPFVVAAAVIREPLLQKKKSGFNFLHGYFNKFNLRQTRQGMSDQAPNIKIWENIFVKISFIRPTGIALRPIQEIYNFITKSFRRVDQFSGWPTFPPK